ncbi:MAG: sodium:proton antiporter, partial [Bacteroidales bacterium]|nr:sodium:proton antiporter [Bacteroidales bacterium]
MHKKDLLKLAISFIPLVILIVLLGLDVGIFGSDSILGASQISLLVASGACIILAMWLYKKEWKEFEDAMKENLGEISTAIIILLLIGGISGTWTMSGIVPTFICYGVRIISPKVFLLTACAICAIVSLMTGSSWTTIATIGVALLGIGRAEGFSDGMIAGAIISGAYFGDKISPLSDTTVLASSMCKVPLFTHIRYMLKTTVPSITLTLIIFLVLGLSHDGTDAGLINEYSRILNDSFNITPWLLIGPVLTAVLIARKVPAIPVL